MDGDGLPTEPSGWDKYDDWALGNDDEDKDYLFELFSNAADRETCLERAWGCLMMQGFVFSASKAQQSVTGVMLTEDEVKMIANKEYVDWETFHTEIIVKIFENRGTNKHNTAKRIVSYDNWKFEYIEMMSRKYPDQIREF